MSFESTAEPAFGDHSHGEGYVHILDSDDSDSHKAENDEGDCQHCCHAHTSSVTVDYSELNINLVELTVSFYAPHISNFAQAPPTPPPSV